MNNKIIALVIVVLVVAGAALLLTNSSMTSKQSDTQTTTNITPAPSGSSDPALQNITIIEVTDEGYKPSTLTVKAGTRVNWINKSTKKVTVHSADHPTHLVYPPLNLGEFPPDGAVQVVIDTPGTYKYHNHYVPTMTGSLVIK